MILDGRAIAADILASVKERVAAAVLGGRIASAPIIRAIVMSPTPATHSYLRIKSARAEDAGMHLDVVHVKDDATTEEVMNVVSMPGADAVIVQLPLPESVTTSLILDEIPISKDADVLSSAAYERFVYREHDALLPPVTAAIKEVLLRTAYPDLGELKGKRAVILGSGKLVGQPAAVWLEEMDADVVVLTRKSESLAELANADVLILGAGSPHLVKPDMLKRGVVLIDAGTSESNGAIVGDADPACAEVASVFTPVPGGMGPIAVACLFQNAADLLSFDSK
jgi:methylenetetrahydrofolate dehydrogenase (NADP+)/methenyltetrahydrofolate cyclohydrolase